MNTPARLLCAAAALLAAEACRPAEISESEFAQGNALIAEFKMQCEKALADNDSTVREDNSFSAISTDNDNLYMCRCQSDAINGLTCTSKLQHDFREEESKKTDSTDLSASSQQHVLESGRVSSETTVGKENPLTLQSNRIEIFQGTTTCAVETPKKLTEGRASPSCKAFIDRLRETMHAAILKLSKNARSIDDIVNEAMESEDFKEPDEEVQ